MKPRIHLPHPDIRNGTLCAAAGRALIATRPENFEIATCESCRRLSKHPLWPAAMVGYERRMREEES